MIDDIIVILFSNTEGDVTRGEVKGSLAFSWEMKLVCLQSEESYEKSYVNVLVRSRIESPVKPSAIWDQKNMGLVTMVNNH